MEKYTLIPPGKIIHNADTQWERGEIQRSCSAERDLAETANWRLDMVLQEDMATEKANEISSTYAEASPHVTDQRDLNQAL